MRRGYRTARFLVCRRNAIAAARRSGGQGVNRTPDASHFPGTGGPKNASRSQRSWVRRACGTSPRCRHICLRRRMRMRNCSPSSRYNRRTRFLFTGQPSRRSMTWMRWYPNRGRRWAMSLIRILSTDWSLATLRLYQAALESPASRHDRITARSKRARIQRASSRRRVGFRVFFEPPP